MSNRIHLKTSFRLCVFPCAAFAGLPLNTADFCGRLPVSYGKYVEDNHCFSALGAAGLPAVFKGFPMPILQRQQNGIGLSAMRIPIFEIIGTQPTLFSYPLNLFSFSVFGGVLFHSKDQIPSRCRYLSAFHMQYQDLNLQQQSFQKAIAIYSFIQVFHWEIITGSYFLHREFFYFRHLFYIFQRTEEAGHKFVSGLFRFGI